MKIGIDIDDTICDTWKSLIPYLSKAFNVDKKILKESNKPYDDMWKYNYDEYCKFAKTYYKVLASKYKLKKNARKIINKLKSEGNEIIFITARSDNGFEDPYKISYDYLSKHKIKFDKLIVCAKDKGKVCKEENIDIFIDDSVHNCQSISSYSIDVLMFDEKWNRDCNDYKRVYNWLDVYKAIKGVKNDG